MPMFCMPVFGAKLFCMPILGEPVFFYMTGNAKTGWDTNSRGTGIVDLCTSGSHVLEVARYCASAPALATAA